MEQELTLSESIFDYLSKNLTYGRSKSSDCIDLISDNFIIDDEDKTVMKLFDNALNTIDLNDFNIRKYLEDTLKTWLDNNRKKINAVHEKDWNNDILELCQLSHDKILFNPYIDQKEINHLKKRIFNLEIHNLNSFLKPDNSSRLKHIPFILKLEKNIFYDINNILLPFIRNAKNIVIIEPYIYSWQNFTNFKKFSEIIPKSIPCKIKLFRNSSKDDKTKHEITIFNEFINDSNRNGYDYVIEYFMLPPNKSSKHIERHILTDKYKIYMPGGFNCIDENGYANISEDDDIKEIKVNKLIPDAKTI